MLTLVGVLDALQRLMHVVFWIVVLCVAGVFVVDAWGTKSLWHLAWTLPAAFVIEAVLGLIGWYCTWPLRANALAQEVDRYGSNLSLEEKAEALNKAQEQVKGNLYAGLFGLVLALILFVVGAGIAWWALNPASIKDSLKHDRVQPKSNAGSVPDDFVPDFGQDRRRVYAQCKDPGRDDAQFFPGHITYEEIQEALKCKQISAETRQLPK
jgi:hypothetical protein